MTAGWVGIPLAQVYVGANVSSVTNSNITDKRVIAVLDPPTLITLPMAWVY